MTFKVGDVVQVTQDDTPPAKDQLFIERHPMFGMIGIVTEVSDHIVAFFNFGPAFPPNEETGLEGFTFVFAPSEITKIGVTLVQPDFNDINLRSKRALQARKAAMQNHPMAQALLFRMEERQKWGHLPPGSDKAKEHVCICEEIRNADCALHSFSIAETRHTEYITEKAIDEKPDAQT